MYAEWRYWDPSGRAFDITLAYVDEVLATLHKAQGALRKRALC